MYKYNKKRMEGNEFKENIELDARMVLAAMGGGMQGVMSWALMHRDIFITTRMVMDRCDWLKKQSEGYITKVSEKAAELEAQSKH